MIVKLLLLSALFSYTLVWAKVTPDFVFPNWKKTFKLNQKAFESEGHNAYIDIYVNELAKEPYIKEHEIFPVGSAIFKPLFADANRNGFARLVIMIKMKAGYDAKNGDWWYGVYDESGMKASHQGRIKSCIDCHAEGRATDFTFSQSVNAEIDRTLFKSRPKWKR